jgi:transporter family-2 protein
MERVLALITTLAVGALIAFQPPSNALLSRHVGDLGAAFFSLVLSTTIVAGLLVISGETSQLGGLSALRPAHLLGGVGGAAIVLVTLISVRHLGAAGVVAALVATQLTVSALIDRFGLLDVKELPLNTTRIAGIALLIAGTILVTSR